MAKAERNGTRNVNHTSEEKGGETEGKRRETSTGEEGKGRDRGEKCAAGWTVLSKPGAPHPAEKYMH
jgi:hypothetical protein